MTYEDAVIRGAAIATKPWLTREELAIFLGCGTDHVDKHVRDLLEDSSRIPGGKRPLFSRDEVVKLIRAGVVTSKSPF